MSKKDIEWKPIRDYEELYQISNYGDIKVIRNGTIKKQTTIHGYRYCSLYKEAIPKTYRVHILVAEHFISKKPNHNSVVGHYDNNKSNNYYKNLYWTTTQENTKKAIDEGLLVSKKGIDNHLSCPIKVTSVETGDIVGVYGSLHECARHIKNVEVSYISKVYKTEYKPRGKKYIYQQTTKEEYFKNKDLINTLLEENPTQNKKPKRFLMTHEESGEEFILDNQKEASKICGIAQSRISNLIKKNGSQNGWKFTLIGEIDDFKESSSYKKFTETRLNHIQIKNVFDDRVLAFDTWKELKRHFNIVGNGTKHYREGKHLIKGEWKVI